MDAVLTCRVMQERSPCWLRSTHMQPQESECFRRIGKTASEGTCKVEESRKASGSTPGHLHFGCVCDV
eukprot:1979686-Prymnesium_polylepis.1